MTREERLELLKQIEKDIYVPSIESTFLDDAKSCAIHSAIEALEQEPCEDVISRKSIKQKLQEHHDFFVNAYGGFSNLPQNDKSRVDEITNCIAMVVNEPSVTAQVPRCKECKWWKDSDGKFRRGCGAESICRINTDKVYQGEGYCYMFEPQKSEG